MKFIRISSARGIYYILLFSSLVISILIYFFLVNDVYPYKIHLKESSGIQFDNFRFYHDFDNDGFSERIQCGKNEYGHKNFFCIYSNSDEIIEQFNFNGTFRPEDFFYEDMNHDYYKEAIVFSRIGDTIYLSIVDVKDKSFLIKEQKLFIRPDSAAGNYWDVYIKWGGKLDINNDGSEELIFALISGYTIYPRSIVAFDVRKKKIIREFNIGGVDPKITFFDFDNNGKREIIVQTSAAGNMKDKTGFHDYTSWIFILDHDFVPVLPPISFGEYPNDKITSIMPFTINGERVLLISVIDAKNIYEKSKALYIDESGALKKFKVFGIKPDALLFKVNEDNNDIFYINFSVSEIWKVNNKFEPLIKKTFKGIIVSLFDINYDGKKEFLGIDTKRNLSAFNEDLEVLLRYNLNDEINPHSQNSITFNNNIFSKNIEFSIIGNKASYYLAVEQNPVYKMLPLILIFIIPLLFLSQVLLYFLLSYLLSLYKTFYYFIDKTNTSIIILDYAGRIKAFNHNVQKIFKLDKPALKNSFYYNAFHSFPFINTTIDNAIKTKKKIQTEFSKSDKGISFEGELIITPFKLLNIPFSYMVEIIDHSDIILPDRLKIWSKTVQKIAHDIKTPLSTIQLNLKALQMRIDNENIMSKSEIESDIKLMEDELKRIGTLTKGFLKFTNLEEPKLQYSSIQSIMNNSLKQFDQYFHKDIAVECNYDPEIDSVWVDPLQLEIVMHIIVENAINAMKGKGVISVSSSMVQDLNNSNDFIQIEISDNGCGIDAAIIEKIFEPYFTTNENGNGIGLAIAKKIIEDHHGKISVYSKLNFGTTFQIIIPIDNSDINIEKV